MPVISHTWIEGMIVTPGNGTNVETGEVVTFTATPLDASKPPTLFVIVDGVSRVNYQLDPVTLSVDYTVNNDISIIAWCEDDFPTNHYPHIVTIQHQIDPSSSVERAAPEVPSGLIFPAGKWRFSQVPHIFDFRFALSELLSSKPTLGFFKNQLQWYRGLNIENAFAYYGNVDTGVPVYKWVEKDFGWGEVARWPEIRRWFFPWGRTPVLHTIDWVWDDPAPQDTGVAFHPVLQCLVVRVQSWSQDAKVGGVLPGGFPSGKTTMIGASTSSIPHGRKLAYYEVSIDIPYFDKGSVYINTPQGPKKIYHLYHVTKINASITPPHGTLLLEGEDVMITAAAAPSNVLNLFTVDGEDRLATNPYIKTNVQADVYVSATAIYDAPPATDGVPYSFQCGSDICGNQLWSAEGLPPGLSINSATGLISGIVPYETPDADYLVTVTLNNDGRIVTRQFRLHSIFAVEPVPGLIWSAVTKLGSGAVTALCQTTSGAILVGTSESKIYRTLDLENFTEVDTMVGSVTSIIQLASGTILAGCYHNPGVPNYLRRSVDDGLTWANGAETPWFSPTITDLLESPAGTVRAIGMFGPLGRSDHHRSIDDGVSMISVGYAGLIATQFGRAAMDNTGKLVATCSGLGYANILRATDGVNPTTILESGLSDARVGDIVTLSDGRMLASIYDRIYRGSADGTTWELLHELPAWGGILTPAIIGCMFAGVVGGKNAVVICCKDAIDGSTVYRSGDGFETYTEAQTPIDGDLSFQMIRLADGKMLMGTDGSITNLWSSIST